MALGFLSDCFPGDLTGSNLKRQSLLKSDATKQLKFALSMKHK
jgi:hypothetical protein